MKVLVNRAALVEALGLAGTVVLSRTPKPVLTCVKLIAGETNGAENKEHTEHEKEERPARKSLPERFVFAHKGEIRPRIVP